MNKRELLLKKIKENNGIINTKEALNFGIHKDILKEELEKKPMDFMHFWVRVSMSIFISHTEYPKVFFSQNSSVFTRIINKNASCLCDDCKGRR